MGAQIRVYRQKIKSTSSMKKIFKAMELIATSRVLKARDRAQASTPYAEAITRAVAAVAGQGEIEHVLTQKAESPRRAAVLIMSSDRGLAGAYSTNVIKRSEQLLARLKEDGIEARPYLYGRKVQQFYDFRDREYDGVWSGSTDKPEVARSQEIGRTLVNRFTQETDQDGVDEIYLVYTQFESMVSQDPVVRRLLPLSVAKETDEAGDTYPNMTSSRILPTFSTSCCLATSSRASSRQCSRRLRLSSQHARGR